MNISRVWAMPNKDTFSIKPIRELVETVIMSHGSAAKIVDPFVGNSPFKHLCYTNDLNPGIDADEHLSAIEFLNGFGDESVDIVLFDPPYSPRQIQECYSGIGVDISTTDTQSKFWGDLKKEIGRIVKPGGIVVSCGWNSGGCGKVNGFEITDVLIVPHGGWHNDTIVTVETRVMKLYGGLRWGLE